MNLSLGFFITNIMLGVGLAMDAFSVSLANGLHEPGMTRRRMCMMAGVFAFFQALMPMLGWFCVHTIVQHFTAFEKFIPWIALILLCYIGGSMLLEGIRNHGDEDSCPLNRIGLGTLLMQGLATSIDALSVGFTIAEYQLPAAVLAVLLIGAVTFAICFTGIAIGRHAGTQLSGKAGILGGSILIFIGIEIFVSSFI